MNKRGVLDNAIGLALLYIGTILFLIIFGVFTFGTIEKPEGIQTYVSKTVKTQDVLVQAKTSLENNELTKEDLRYRFDRMRETGSLSQIEKEVYVGDG